MVLAECHRDRERHAKGLCLKCYRKNYYKRPVILPTCHPDRKHKAKGLCHTCYRMQNQKMALCHPDRPHRAKGLCGTCYNRQPYIREQSRLINRIHNIAKSTGRPYKDVKVEVDALLERVSSCEICGSTKKLCFDHCHKTGRVRGLLCHGHNMLLGFAKDNEDILHNTIRYLGRFERRLYVESWD